MKPEESSHPTKNPSQRKNFDGKPPVRVYRDEAGKTSATPPASSSNVPPKPHIKSATDHAPTPLEDPRNMPPLIQLPISTGSWRNNFRPHYRGPQQGRFNPNFHNFNNPRRPRFPRPSNSYPRPSLRPNFRPPLQNIDTNLPLDWRTLRYNQLNHANLAQHPTTPGTNFNNYPPTTPNLLPPTSQMQTQHIHSANPYSQQFQQPPIYNHPTFTNYQPPPQYHQHSQVAPPTNLPSQNESALDPETGIIQPNHTIITKMQNMGLRVTYAVAWKNGGGVFLSKSEAQVSHSTASAANSNPQPIKTFADMSMNLTQNIALAANWILLQNSTQPKPVPPASTPSSSSSSGKTISQPQTPPPAPTPKAQASQTPSPPPPNNNAANQLTPQSATPRATDTPPSNSSKSTTSSESNNQATLFSAKEWSFSQEDILVRKCLLDKRFAPISIVEKTPDPNRLPYIAAPGTAKGIIISSNDTGIHNMVIDPATGTISIKPRHLPTLRLLDFPTFLSLMFRAIDMANRCNSIIADRAAVAVRNLIRDLTRQYESLSWSNEQTTTWPILANLIWTHMIQTRTLLTGFNSEQAFLSEARKRSHTSNPHVNYNNPYQLSSTSSTTSLIHPSVRPAAASSNKPTKFNNINNSKSSHWFICPCCSKPNDHFSSTCPTQSKGPKPIPKYIQEATKATIKAAPIPQSAKDNLLRMSNATYSKLETPSS